MIEKKYYWTDSNCETDLFYYTASQDSAVVLESDFSSEELAVVALEKFLSYEKYSLASMEDYYLKCKYRKVD